MRYFVWRTVHSLKGKPLNRNFLDTIKGRLFAAEALLSAPPGAVNGKLARKTLASTTDALRVSIERLELALAGHERIRAFATAAQDRYDLLLNALPIAAVATSHFGEIAGVNLEAGLLLNTAPRGLIGKSLLLFFDERDSWVATLREVQLQDAGVSVRRSAAVRPKERARKQMLARIVRLDDETLQWFLLPNV